MLVAIVRDWDLKGSDLEHSQLLLELLDLLAQQNGIPACILIHHRLDIPSGNIEEHYHPCSTLKSQPEDACTARIMDQETQQVVMPDCRDLHCWTRRSTECR